MHVHALIGAAKLQREYSVVGRKVPRLTIEAEQEISIAYSESVVRSITANNIPHSCERHLTCVALMETSRLLNRGFGEYGEVAPSIADISALVSVQ
jgi:hypothetical protein